MSATQLAVLTGRDRSNQFSKALLVSNRLTVAEISLKGATLLSDGVVSEIKGINEEQYLLTDSIILGEDVSENLDIIEERVTQLERMINA